MKKHIMIGSLICVATVLIFLVFWGKLPSDVPIHFDSNGNVNSVLPKTAVVFGTPAICAILNVFSGFALMKKHITRVCITRSAATIQTIDLNNLDTVD